MNIAFCGASCTGKTTLASEIAKTLGLPFIDDVARSVAKEQKLYTQSAQRLIVQRYAALPLKHNGGYVSSRSLVDLHYYSSHYSDLASTTNQLYADNKQIIFYVPITPAIPWKSDSVRIGNPLTRRIDDKGILAALGELVATDGRGFIRLESTTLPDRVKEVMRILLAMNPQLCMSKIMQLTSVRSN